MAGFGGRNRGKRQSSSSSSYFSMITLVVFLAFCLFGLWMLTTSSVVPSHVLHNRRSGQRPSFGSSVFYSSPPPPSSPDLSSVSFDDKSGGLDEKIELPREEEVEAGSAGGGGEQKEESKEEEIQQRSEERVEAEGGGDENQRVEKVEEQEQEKNEADENQRQLEQQSNDEGGENKRELEGEGDVKQQESEEQQQQQTESESEEKASVSSKVQSEGESEESSQQQEGGSTIDESSESTEQQSEESQQKQAEEKLNDANEGDFLPEDRLRSEVTNLTTGQNRPWTTQADQSDNEKERRKESTQLHGDGSGSELGNIVGQNWELCNVTAGTDYIPCLDNEKALKTVHITGHYEHRERHCPDEGPKCLVPLPLGYQRPIEWPTSRDKIWYNNVPRTKLAHVKGHQNWVKVTGEYLTFPGGGTQFIHGALHYIDFVQKAVPRIAWGKHTRVILDVGCGVASFGGFLFERNVIAMSFAPKDEHEAQVQFALERGIPAISAVMGTQRLPFPSRVFDIVHCARCRVPWHADGGALLLELNRALRPGGYFVWSATPVYQKLEEDVQIWKAMSALTISMCWDLVNIKKDRLNGIAVAIYRKPVSNECYDNRKIQEPPMCKEDDDANAAWYVPLQSCMHKVPIHSSERGSQWPADWPRRLKVPPYWLNSSEIGIYGKPPTDDFAADFQHWKRVVSKSYLTGMDIEWSKIRNVMDMRAVYGGFAAALKDLNIWVMNVVNIDSSDTLPIIYERGLFGIYHDWCESFSTYPRTYDLLHADHLLSGLKKRCDILPVVVEVDRILRPGGKLIVRDEPSVVSEVETMLKSLHWDVRLTFSKGEEGILCAEKTEWRPETFSSSS